MYRGVANVAFVKLRARAQKREAAQRRALACAVGLPVPPTDRTLWHVVWEAGSDAPSGARKARILLGRLLPAASVLGRCP